ncbi:MAG TPA: Holliday junction branch migration protein RuvA [Opitutae bacterium]|nr:Holliday junction branch migration protein RuvA [Opitutae bacterium]|tara:strand:+ start:245 stop:850 length:606 start_codon:yes stop_codon:yes gene_type:complete
MIVSIEGTLKEAHALSTIIDVQGIGYEVHTPLTTSERLPAIGQRVSLHTLSVYREDAALLYGFMKREERDFFRLIVEKVSGVGPKIALGILSKLSLPVLEQAIRNGDAALLAKCPGIGKKTAERIVIELKDKISPASSSTSRSTSSIEPLALSEGSSQQDAVSALVALGYKINDADRSIRKAISKLGPDASTEALIKNALN